MAELLQELARNSDNLVYGLHHMHGDADRPRLVCDSAGDCLTDPPRRVGRELVSLGVVKLLDRLDKAEVALLDEVKKEHAAADIALCYRHDQAQVCLGHAALCLLVALAHSYGQLHLLLCRQQRNLADLLEEHAHGIVSAVAVINLDLGHLLLGDLLDLVELFDLRHVDIVENRHRVVGADVYVDLIGLKRIVKLRNGLGIYALFLKRRYLLGADFSALFSLFHELVQDILCGFNFVLLLGGLLLNLCTAGALFFRRVLNIACCQQLVSCALELLLGHGFGFVVHSFTPHILWFL